VLGGVALGRKVAAEILDVFQERSSPVFGEVVNHANAGHLGLAGELG
jgi:hypothetical protein